MKVKVFYSLALLAFCQSLVSASLPQQRQGLEQHSSLEQRSPVPQYGTKSSPLLRRVDGPDSAAGEPGHGGRRTEKTSPTDRRNFRIAHGTIMATTFTISFPLGGIFIRTLKPPGHVYIHAAMQTFSLLSAMAGMGVGIWLGLNTRFLDYAHTIIGFSVIAALWIQPILGIIHHLRFKKVHMTTWWGRIHRWFGRSLIIVGIVNGGLGLLLAENTRVGTIAYAVVAGVAGLIYIPVVVVGTLSQKKAAHAYAGVKTEST